MGAFAFICKKSGGSWSAKAYSKEDGYDESLTAEADSTYALERALVKLALSKASGAVQTSFNQITPSSAVIVVNVGGAVVAAVAAGGAGAAPAGGGGAAPAAKEEAKKEESEEEEDMGFSLFD